MKALSVGYTKGRGREPLQARIKRMQRMPPQDVLAVQLPPSDWNWVRTVINRYGPVHKLAGSIVQLIDETLALSAYGDNRPPLRPNQVIGIDQVVKGETYILHAIDSSTYRFTVITDPYRDVAGWRVDGHADGYYSDHLYLSDYGVIPFSRGHWSAANWLEFTIDIEAQSGDLSIRNAPCGDDSSRSIAPVSRFKVGDGVFIDDLLSVYCVTAVRPIYRAAKLIGYEYAIDGPGGYYTEDRLRLTV